jgi:hypothetical protein
MIAVHKYPRSFDFHKQPGKKPAVKQHTSQHRRTSSSSTGTSSISAYDMSNSSGLHREGKRAAGTVQCKFQTSAGGCRRGSDCPFKHTAKQRGRVMQELTVDDNDDTTTTDDNTTVADSSSAALQLDVSFDDTTIVSDTDADHGGSRSMEQSISPCKRSTTATVDSSSEQHNDSSRSSSTTRDATMEVEVVDDNDLNTAMRRLYIPREISFGRGRGRHRLSGF